MKTPALALIVFLASPVAADEPKRDVGNELEGTWAVVSMEFDGKRVDADALVGQKWTFGKDGEMSLRFPGQEDPANGEYRVDPARKPKELDYWIRGGENHFRCIYKAEGDRLTVCQADSAISVGKERPATFESRPGSRHRLVVLKRAKP